MLQCLLIRRKIVGSLTPTKVETKNGHIFKIKILGYIGAEIKSIKDDQITVVTKRGNELAFKKDQVQEMNPPKYTKTEDMANLTYVFYATKTVFFSFLNEAS